MKAIMILIVAAGVGNGEVSGSDQVLQVREIEFSTMKACQKAAGDLNRAAHRSEERTRTFSRDPATGRVLVPAPVVIAECVRT